MRQRPRQLEALESWLSAPRAPEIVLVFLGLVIVYPIWVVSRPPIQDLPQHVAAVRVLSSFSDPSFRFQDYFVLTLSKTQYLTVYLLSIPFAKLLGPTVATKIVLSAALVLTAPAMSRLLRALQYDPWLSLLGLPFVFNVHVAYGFLNFVAAIPLLLLGLAWTVELRQTPNSIGSWRLAVLLVVCFFTHVVPFGLLLLVVVVLGRWDKTSLRRQVCVVAPSSVALVVWLLGSPAGRVVATLGRARHGESTSMIHIPFGTALRVLPDWIIRVTTSEDDSWRLIVWMLMALVLLVLTVVSPVGDEPSSAAADHPEAHGIRRQRTFERLVVLLLVPLCMVGYFALPNGYSFIWPICQRFPVLALWVSIPLFARAPVWSSRIAGALCVGLSLMAVSEQAQVFRAGSQQAYEGFDAAVEQIPKGSRVVTLVFDRQIEGLPLSPLMHAAGWVQVERGGLVMFSFAEFPSSPFTYRDDRRPPAVPPRWEWTPERVVPDRDLGWYDYCLVHGWSASLQASQSFSEVSRHGRWSLWRRIGPSR